MKRLIAFFVNFVFVAEFGRDNELPVGVSVG